jgi:hypothetical protein
MNISKEKISHFINYDLDYIMLTQLSPASKTLSKYILLKKKGICIFLIILFIFNSKMKFYSLTFDKLLLSLSTCHLTTLLI